MADTRRDVVMHTHRRGVPSNHKPGGHRHLPTHTLSGMDLSKGGCGDLNVCLFADEVRGIQLTGRLEFNCEYVCCCSLIG